MDSNDLQRLDTACLQLYSSSSPNKGLLLNSTTTTTTTTSSNSLLFPPSQLQHVLIHSQSPYTLMHCIQYLRTQTAAATAAAGTGPGGSREAGIDTSTTSTSSTTDNNVLKEMRSFLLLHLLTRPSIINLQPPFILAGFAQLIALISKNGWFIDDAYRSTLADVSSMFLGNNSSTTYPSSRSMTPSSVQSSSSSTTSSSSPSLPVSVHLQMAAMHILTALVAEMNNPIAAAKNPSRHRKAAVNFRDTQLLEIFQISLSLLQKILNDEIQFESAAQATSLEDLVLKLTKQCLSFDFIGTIPDESSEDVGTIQIPSSWKPVISDFATISTLFSGYKRSQGPQAALCMECLSMIVSTRRSIFNNDADRSKFLGWIIEITLDILKTEHGMNEEANFHEFCRLLTRLKTVNQLSELIENPLYSEWVELAASFTMKSFHGMTSWPAPHSMVYLMTFWSKMVLSVVSVSSSVSSNSRPKAHDRLEVIAGQMTQAFIRSKLDSITADSDFESVVEEENELVNLLELVASIARLKYTESTRFLISAYDSLASQYYESTRRGSPTFLRTIIESKFTFLVYLIGAFIWARPPIPSSEDHDIIDGELTCKVLELMFVNQKMNVEAGGAFTSEQIDFSFLYFFQMFRKSYIGDQSVRGSKLYVKLNDVFSLSDTHQVLNIIVEKLATNLKCWPNNSKIVSKSLSLFSDIASGYTSVKLLRKTDAAKMILSQHSAEYFPFLTSPINIKSRSLYYAALSRLLQGTDDNQDDEFLEFVQPFTNLLVELNEINSIEAYRSEKVRLAIDGLFRDLRGLCSSMQGKRVYMMFFDWFYPYCNVLMKGIEANHDNPTAISLLKFFNEFVQNKSQRLNFDVSSAGGILLFRETSKVLNKYGTLLLSKSMDVSNKWASVYKGITFCFHIIRWSLSGKYVNFGVFELYNDPALSDVLEIYFRLMMAVPLDDMMTFPKLTTSYFQLFQVFSSEQMLTLGDMDPSVFLYFMRSSAEGLRSLDSGIPAQVSVAIDSVFSFVFKYNSRRQTVMLTTPPNYLVQRIEDFPFVVTIMMSRLLEVLLFDDHPTQWSLTRPLLPLVLLNRDFLLFYTTTLLNEQPVDRQEMLSKFFQDLTDGLENNLSAKNRDKFTQQIINFRRELTTRLITLHLPASLTVYSDLQ